MMSADIVGQKIDDEQLYDSVNLLLSLQVKLYILIRFSSNFVLSFFKTNCVTKTATLYVERKWRCQCVGAIPCI